MCDSINVNQNTNKIYNDLHGVRIIYTVEQVAAIQLRKQEET